MRLAFISAMAGSPWGGSELLWSEAASRLVAQGHAVLASVVGWPQLASPLVKLQQNGAIVVQRSRPSSSLWGRQLRRLQRRILQQGDNDTHWRTIRMFRPDLVCISHGAATCGIDWMSRCLDAGIPYVSVCQANYEFWWPEDHEAEHIRRAYQGAAASFFVSQRNLRLFESQLACSLPRAEVVWNPVNVRRHAAPEWPLGTGAIKLACVGRLDPKAKGQDLIVEVMASEKWRARGVHVSLFGDGPCRLSLERLVASRHLGAKIEFKGHVANVESIWRTHHALLLPSRFEGLPLAIVEAMLCGRPCIVTDVAGNAEVVTDNRTGFVAAAPVACQLDEAMERAWLRRGDLQTIGCEAARSIGARLPQDPGQTFADKLKSTGQLLHG